MIKLDILSGIPKIKAALHNQLNRKKLGLRLVKIYDLREM